MARLVREIGGQRFAPHAVVRAEPHGELISRRRAARVDWHANRRAVRVGGNVYKQTRGDYRRGSTILLGHRERADVHGSVPEVVSVSRSELGRAARGVDAREGTRERGEHDHSGGGVRRESTARRRIGVEAARKVSLF